MIATTGRWRLGDFKAAIVAAASSVMMGGAALADGAGGSERSHVPKLARRTATRLNPLHRMICMGYAIWDRPIG
jgi:hypothetical protein